MKLFIVALKGLEYPTMPQCARDALACAQHFSGSDVIGLSDYGVEGWEDAVPYGNRAYAFRKAFLDVCGQDDRSLPAIMRWFMIEEYIRVHSITEPISQIDWEVLVFGDLESHFHKCSVSGCDIGDTVDRQTPAPHNRTAPYYVKNHAAILFFTRMLEAHVAARTPLFVQHKCGGDMNWWEHVRLEGGFTPVNLAGEVDDALFDLNILLDQDIYESHNCAKRVFWKEGQPYFKRQSDGGMVKAVALHCFWSWKDKTSDLMHKALSGYSD